MLVVPVAPASSGLRRRAALIGVLLAVAASSGCMSDETAPGPATPSLTVGPTSGEDTTSAPGAPSGTEVSRSSRSTGSAASPDQPGLAAATVSRFYSAYIAAPGRKTAADYVVPQLLADLFSSVRDVDRVLCSHALPTAISVTPGAVTGANVTVAVTTAQQGAARPPIRVTVRTKDQRIVGIACPA